MEVLRYYIHCDDYKNALLVCKDWRDYLVPTQGAMRLVQKLHQDGYIECYKNDLALMNNTFQPGAFISIKKFIDTLEAIPDTNSNINFMDKLHAKYVFPMTWYTSIQIKKSETLRSISLLDY